MIDYLATKRAKTEGIKKTAFTNFTSVGDTFTRPRLRPFIKENNPSTIDYIGLYSIYIKHFLNFRYPYHIMV